MAGKVVTKVEEILIPLCEQHGVLLYDLVFEAGGRALKIFIDKKDSEKGVQLEDCKKISRALSEVLDENEDMIPGDDYTLEVSSPGIERKLSKPWHFSGALNSKIEIKLFEAAGKIFPEIDKKYMRAKTLQAKLIEADEESFSIELNGNSFRFPYDKLVKANVVFDF